MTDPTLPRYEVAVVGGGPAGLTTALYATRLGHRTAVFEKEGGRHAAAAHVHNLYGISEEVSGRELSERAAEQLDHYGGDYYPDAVRSVRRTDGDEGERTDDEGVDDERASARFRLEAAHATVDAERVVFATGFRDRPPDVPELERFTGRGLYYCLHCDAYALGDGRVFVLGHGEHAAHVAMTMLNFTADVDLLLDGREPDWSDETDEQLAAHPLERVETTVVSAYERESEDGAGPGEGPQLGGLAFGDGTERDYLGGFAVYGTAYNAELAADLGCELADDGAIVVDENRETSVDGAYAVGDVTHGQNQTAIAIGDGAYAGLAIHKDLRRFPADVEDLEAGDGSIEAPGSPSDARARMRVVRERERHPGLGESSGSE